MIQLGKQFGVCFLACQIVSASKYYRNAIFFLLTLLQDTGIAETLYILS